MTIIRLGTRSSILALAQADLAASGLSKHGISTEIKAFKTTGDKITHIPLYDIGGKALFSKELERALLKNEIDFAVHSLKDLETPRPKGLVLAAYLPRADVWDVCVTHVEFTEKKIFGLPFEKLPQGARVGTCSPRRREIMLALRPDLVIEPIRGNVPTRLSKVTKERGAEKLDAVIVAKAGLDRLGYSVEEKAVLCVKSMVPAAGQGIIALECREEDEKTRTLLTQLNCDNAQFEAEVERGFVESLGAGCRSAVGIHVSWNEKKAYVFLDLTFNRGFTQREYSLKADTAHACLDEILA